MNTQPCAVCSKQGKSGNPVRERQCADGQVRPICEACGELIRRAVQSIPGVLRARAEEVKQEVA